MCKMDFKPCTQWIQKEIIIKVPVTGKFRFLSFLSFLIKKIYILFTLFVNVKQTSKICLYLKTKNFNVLLIYKQFLITPIITSYYFQIKNEKQNGSYVKFNKACFTNLTHTNQTKPHFLKLNHWKINYFVLTIPWRDRINPFIHRIICVNEIRQST